MLKSIKMDELRCLHDTELLKQESFKTFNFMQKRHKVAFISFEPNSKKIWIFPLSAKSELTRPRTYLCLHQATCKLYESRPHRSSPTDPQNHQRYLDNVLQKTLSTREQGLGPKPVCDLHCHDPYSYRVPDQLCKNNIQRIVKREHRQHLWLLILSVPTAME